MDYTEGQTMDVPGAVLITHTPAAPYMTSKPIQIL